MASRSKRRSLAIGRFHIIRRCLEDGVPLARVAEQNHLSERTVRRWAERYRQFGLAGLCRKGRADKSKRRMFPTLEHLIEGLALQEPAASGVDSRLTPGLELRTGQIDLGRGPGGIGKRPDHGIDPV